MAAPALPTAVIDGLRRWQTQRRRGWQLAEARAIQPALAQAAQLPLHPALEEVGQALRDFSLYLASLVDGAVETPTPVQRKRLLELEEVLVRHVREHIGGTASLAQDVQIAVLAPPSPLLERLAGELAGHGLSLRHADQTAAFLPWLGSRKLQAVLVDQSHLLDLGSVADRIESRRSKDRLGPTVVFLNRDRQLEQRLLALSGGADACLEGEDSDYILARVLELVEAQSPQQHLKVLIVEDDRSQALYCETILRKQGIEVRTVADSRQTLGQLAAFQPDLVLMDLHMPTLDGMQLTALIREDPSLGMLPIVFLTGEQDEGRRFDALQAGGDDYLLKPVRPRHLVTAVVTRARRARALRRQFEQHARKAADRRLHRGELVARLRALEASGSSGTLLLAAADDGRLTADGGHALAEAEREDSIATAVSELLATHECVATWSHGSFLILLQDAPSDEGERRAETIRGRLQELSERACSVAVVRLQTGQSGVEAALDLAERTLLLARAAGGERVQQALAELNTDLDAAASFNLQKALAREQPGEQLRFEYQPIVPLHGAVRPQFQLHLRLLGENGEVFTRRQWLEVARQTGSMERLDRFLLTRTLDQIGPLRERYPSVRLVVALGVDSVLSAAFRKALLLGLSQRQLLEPGLIITIDEAEALSHLRALLQARLELAAARVAIGIGRTSIHPRAHELIDALKPEWVALDAPKMLVDPEARAVINHAHERGAEVVAHFIPDSQAMARLFALGVDYGIGRFIGPPSVEAEFDFGA